MKRAALLQRFIMLAFALVTLGGLFAVPAAAATGGTTPSVFQSGVMAAGNPDNGPVHKVWTRSLSAAACKAVRKANPKASCSITVTIDARIVNGPQKPPAAARVAARAARAAASSSYWTYEIGTMTARGAIWYGTLREEVAYHDNCPNAECPNQGVVWNQWIDTSGYACYGGCTISNIQDGVIGNGTKALNGWENFAVNCDLSITGNSVGCNSGHGNRLYFNSDAGAWGGFSF